MSIHTQSHPMTDTNSHTANNHQIFFSNGSGQVVELGHGTSGQVLQSQGTTSAPIWAADVGVTDHGALTGNDDDDHAAVYNNKDGRSGGQTQIGDTLASGDLTLQSTANATRGSVFIESNFEFNNASATAFFLQINGADGAAGGGFLRVSRASGDEVNVTLNGVSVGATLCFELSGTPKWSWQTSADGTQLNAFNNIFGDNVLELDTISATEAQVRPGSDNEVALGTSANKWSDIRAVTATFTGLVAGITPVNDADFTTKSFVLDLVNGLDWKPSVRVATAAALPANTSGGGSGAGHTLTADAVGILTVDGIATLIDDRILVQDEGDSDNGLYKVTTVGTAGVAFILTRAEDSDEDSEVTSRLTVGVEEGTVNGGANFTLTNTGTITVDTTVMTFTAIAGPGSFTGGDGINISGSSITVDLVDSNAGLKFSTGELQVDLAGTSGLTLTSGLQVGAGNGITVATSTILANGNGSGTANTIGTVTVDGSGIGVDLGSTSVKACSGADGRLLDDITAAGTDIVFADISGLAIDDAAWVAASDDSKSWLVKRFKTGASSLADFYFVEATVGPA